MSKSASLTAIICIAIVVITTGIIYWINNSEPTATPETATKRSAMLVETITVNRDDYVPTIQALGTVRAADEVTLRAQVGGRITEIAESFQPGELVKTGDVLARIESADYEIEIANMQSRLLQAQAELSLEEGRQAVAKKEYTLLDENLKSAQRALVLREPQLQAARAAVASAQSALDQAQINLERTVIRAPFDAQVIQRDVSLGSIIQPSTVIGHLVGTEEYWVIASVPMNKLAWIQFSADGGSDASTVEIRKRGIWNGEQVRSGHVLRFIGTLDEQTRLARVLISIDDPISLQSEEPGLLLDAIVETIIQAKALRNVVRLERSYLRKDSTVWVMEDGKLSIRPVTVLFEDPTYSYISEGLSDGEEVVITNLSRVREGAELRKGEQEQ